MDVIIIGCGRVGSELAQITQEKSHQVVIVDRDANSFNRLREGFRGRTLQGDVRDEKVLLRAGIESADGFAAVTPNDEINLVATRSARELFGIKNVVARVYDPKHAPMFNYAGVQTVISASWTAQRIEQLLTHPGTIELTSLGNGEVSIIEMQIPPQMAGKKISEVAIPGVLTVFGLLRAGQASLVEPETQVQEGDNVVLAVLTDRLREVESMFRREGE